MNEKCNLFTFSLVRFLETKYHVTVADMSIEFFMNDSGSIYLTGAEHIIFYGLDGQSDPSLDKNNLEKYKVVLSFLFLQHLLFPIPSTPSLFLITFNS